jgi:hypothetical protein
MIDRAPDPNLLACLEVLYRAIVDARSLAWSGANNKDQLSAKRDEQIADLMDAVHNIPLLLLRWGRCDESVLRRFLESYDEKWPGEGRSLLATYDRAMAEGRGSAGSLREQERW